jgi:hypothetical protein
MNDVADLASQMRKATDDLPSVLSAAYTAFEGMLMAIRGCEDPDTGLFAAFVMAAASAADGRDALVHAPSLPIAMIGRPSSSHPAGQASPGTSARSQDLVSLAIELTGRLTKAEHDAAEPGDQVACAQAAACAREIRDLFALSADE